jgi:hypothetical protein
MRPMHQGFSSGHPLLLSKQVYYSTNHDNLPDFIGESSVGADSFRHQCPGLPGENNPQTDSRPFDGILAPKRLSERCLNASTLLPSSPRNPAG